MTTYTTVFGGQTISPSQILYQRLILTTNQALDWPVESPPAGATLFTDVANVSSDQANRVVTFPRADQGPPGAEMMFNNVGAFTVLVHDFAGNEIGAVPSGEVWYFYLNDNTTQAGAWSVFEFGTGTSSAVAAALAGAGLKAIVNTLNVKIAPTVTNVTPTAILNADRAELFVWNGGVGTFTLPTPASVGSDWFVYIRNGGGGELTVTPAAGTVNGAASLAMSPGDSAIFVSDGTNYFTVGFGQSVAGLFDYTSINVAGSGNYTLAGGELNRISYQLTGTLTGARSVIVPASVQQYWVYNGTGGAFSLTVKTLAGSGVVVPQGTAMLLSCDGTNVRAWEGTPTAGVLPIARGALNMTTVAQGDIPYGSAVDVYSRLAKDVNATRYLSNQGASNGPSWNQVNLANGVTGVLPFANLTDGSALSLFGRASNTAGVMASIVAALDGQVMRRSGTSIAFGAVDLANANAITGDLPDANLSANVPLKDGANIFTSTNAFTVLLATLSGDPIGYLGFPFDDDSPHLTDYTLEANDDGKCVFFSAAHGAGDTVTIPSNGSGTFSRLGVTILVINDSDTDTLEIAIDTDTLYLAGTTTTGPQTLKVKGACLLYRTQSTEWIVIPLGNSIDYLTPVTAPVYAGYVASAAASSQFNPAAAGWAATNPGTGRTLIKHNLGLSSANDLAITPAMVSAADDRVIMITALTVNSFEYTVNDLGGGPVDVPTFFHAVRLV